MKYEIKYTAAAKQDLYDIHEYIAFCLLAPVSAGKLIKRITKAIRSLEELPLRHRLYEEEPWHSRGIRVFPVNHYLIFYVVQEQESTVTVMRIVYERRDLVQQLQEITFDH